MKINLANNMNAYILNPQRVKLIQNPNPPILASDTEYMETIADYFEQELIDPSTVYVLGPGLTVDRIATRLGVTKKTLLGVDVVRGDGTILGLDVSEAQILPLVKIPKLELLCLRLVVKDF